MMLFTFITKHTTLLRSANVELIPFSLKEECTATLFNAIICGAIRVVCKRIVWQSFLYKLF